MASCLVLFRFHVSWFKICGNACRAFAKSSSAWARKVSAGIQWHARNGSATCSKLDKSRHQSRCANSPSWTRAFSTAPFKRAVA